MSEQPANTVHTVVILGASKGGYGGVWGMGENLISAKARFRREGGRLTFGYTILRFGEGAEFVGVDGFGRVSWTGPRPEVEDVKSKVSK